MRQIIYSLTVSSFMLVAAVVPAQQHTVLPDAPDSHLPAAQTAAAPVAQQTDSQPEVAYTASVVREAPDVAELLQQSSTPAPGGTGSSSSSQQSSSSDQTTGQTGPDQKKTATGADKDLKMQNTPGAAGNRIQYATPGGVQPNTPAPDFGRQPKRILGMMPNYRAVSADVRPAPPTTGEKFKIATQNTFDYSSFIFAAIDAEFPYVSKSYPTLGNGWSGYGQYYWRSFVDKGVGNYMTDFLLPTITHEDARYFTLGKGRKLYRAYYAVTRLAITPNDQGKNTINLSEIVGKGAQAGIGNLYYPSPNGLSWTKTGQRWILQIGRDGLTNVFREFWPDISTHVLHLKKSQT